MTRNQNLKVVQKRINHLKKRIESSDKDLTFDKQEVSALEWVLKREESLQKIQKAYLDELDKESENLGLKYE